MMLSGGWRSGWRSGLRQVFASDPSRLGFRALYDGLASSSTAMADRSGNGVAAITLGGTVPLWLPYTVPSVHLEAATAGTNQITCTAPAGTASYSAAPRGGGAATTGAAAPGAFAFSTAGDWLSIQLLTAGAAEVAKFDVAQCGQLGHTDSYGVAWTVGRGTAGAKTVVQSPVAGSDLGIWLFRGAGWGTIPAGAFPDMTAAEWSMFAVIRQHETPVASDRIISTASGGGAEVVAMNWSTATTIGHYLNTGGPSQTASRGVTHCVMASSDGATNANLDVDGTRATAAVGSHVDSTQGRLGCYATAATAYGEFELMAFGTANRILTSAETATICAFYKAA